MVLPGRLTTRLARSPSRPSAWSARRERRLDVEDIGDYVGVGLLRLGHCAMRPMWK
jgi:hypothetical protein